MGDIIQDLPPQGDPTGPQSGVSWNTLFKVKENLLQLEPSHL